MYIYIYIHTYIYLYSNPKNKPPALMQALAAQPAVCAESRRVILAAGPLQEESFNL